MCEFTRLRDLAVVVRRRAIPEVVSSVIAGTISLDEAFRISQCADQLSELNNRDRKPSLADRMLALWNAASPEEREEACPEIRGMIGEATPKQSGVLFSLTTGEGKKTVTDVDQKFSDFYAEFPRKVNKAKARIAFGKAMGRLQKQMPAEQAFRTIMDGVRVYAKHADPEVLCHPTTWLNGDRWEDDPAGIGKPVRASRNVDNAMLGTFEDRDPTPISEAVF